MTASTTDDDGSASEFWLYGYGSLIWKPPPHFDRRVPGWVTGYVRRFWQVCGPAPLPSMPRLTDALANPPPQASEDHRGTPEAPGRVVTLIERAYWEKLTDHHDSAPERVWGVAYRIIPERVAEVKEYLDIREINGYSIHYTPFHPADGSPPISTLVYIGTPDNEQFVGPQDPNKLARHVLASRGPSGLNKEYLYNLDVALDELSPGSGDVHVSDLASRVKALEHDQTVASPSPPPANAHFKRRSSITEAEELEKA
ncbi:cation transport regulator-like protein 2 [Purpureocillium lilacinum]|uniref:glutathione-specific gamma-glutamylcyclotransferase n=1 Tax=Purpureocillium lilacinum TaxID=33203 RepID=A0A179HMT1_PURLI|nr:cation transport regulator-like protein 2 [Purpureocillium lilacinum]OAQ90978.1 cation transport regulator-like protein 2 [Purpureocillium lilacinum]